MPLRQVSVVGIGQVPVKKRYEPRLRHIAADAVRLAMEDATRRLFAKPDFIAQVTDGAGNNKGFFENLFSGLGSDDK